MIHTILALCEKYAAFCFFMCVAAYGAIQVSYFHQHVAIETLCGDGVNFLPRWLKGDTAWNLTHQHSIQTPVTFLTLLADIYIGPFPYWSRALAYTSWALLFLAIRHVLPSPRGDAVASIGMLMWFSFMNRAALFQYTFFQVEVASSLFCVAGLIASGRVWLKRDKNTSCLLICLGILIFAFSHVHKGFYFPILFGALGACLAESRAHTLAFLTYTVAYLAYILWLDGFVMILAKQAQNGRATNYLDVILSIPLLATAAVGAALRELNDGARFTAARCVVFTTGIAMGVDSLRRIAVLRDCRFVPPAALIVPSAATAAIICLGRFADVGFKLEQGERYWYTSVLFLTGMLMYAATLKVKTPFIAVASITGVTGAILTIATSSYIPHFVHYWYAQNCIQIGRALNPGVRWESGGYTGRVVDDFRFSQQFLSEMRADVFALPGIGSLNYLPKPAAESTSCTDVTFVKTQVSLGSETADRVQSEIASTIDVDFGVIYDAGAPIAMSYVLDIGGVHRMTYYAPHISPDAQCVLYKWNSTGFAATVCQCLVGQASSAK